MQMPKVMPNISFESRFALTKIFADITERHGKSILIISVAALIMSVLGALKLNVENSFIDYFRENTEIYQGMKTIDQQLGGTTSLDVVINLEQNEDDSKIAAKEEKTEVAIAVSYTHLQLPTPPYV